MSDHQYLSPTSSGNRRPVSLYDESYSHSNSPNNTNTNTNTNTTTTTTMRTTRSGSLQSSPAHSQTNINTLSSSASPSHSNSALNSVGVTATTTNTTNTNSHQEDQHHHQHQHHQQHHHHHHHDTNNSNNSLNNPSSSSSPSSASSSTHSTPNKKDPLPFLHSSSSLSSAPSSTTSSTTSNIYSSPQGTSQGTTFNSVNIKGSASTTKPSFSGTLRCKTSNTFSAWRLRYFVLVGGELKCLSSKTDNSASYILYIPDCEVTAIPSKFQLDIKLPSKLHASRYSLKASNSNDFQCWEAALKRAKSYVPTDNVPRKSIVEVPPQLNSQSSDALSNASTNSILDDEEMYGSKSKSNPSSAFERLEAKQTAVMVARDDFLTKIKDMIETLDIQDTHDVKLPNLDAANVSSGGSVRDKKGRAGREAAVAAAAASSALFALKTSVHRLQGSAMEMLSLYTDYTAALENNSLQLKTLYEKESLKLKQMEKSLANLARQHAALERKTSMCITGQGFQADADVDLDEDDDEFEDADASSNRDSQLKQHDEEDAASIDSSGSEAEFFDAMEGEAKAKASIATTAPGTPNKHLSKVSFSTVPHPGSASSNNSTSSTSSNALVPARTATTSSTGISKTPRTALPVFKSDKKLNIWKLIKDAIGKDFSKISMPVILNEPLSALQRFTEDIEYYTILNDAVKQASSLERMVYVTAFAISSYASTLNRTGKPFNPLLGETFEYYDPDNNIALVAEQVSHHPPVSAFHCSGPGWIWWKEVAVQSKFKGKDMEVTPIGWSHVTFPTHGNEHYTWRKVTTAVHNLIVGKLWVENFGNEVLTNHTTGDKCIMDFQKYSYFGKSEIGRVTASVRDAAGREHYRLEGNYDDTMEFVKSDPTNPDSINLTWAQLVEKNTPHVIFKRHPHIEYYDEYYNFTKFSLALNDIDETMARYIAPTDSRRRPDQRELENGNLDGAQNEKTRLEEKQRAARRLREAKGEEWYPCWFELKFDEHVKADTWIYMGRYFEAREKGAFSNSPDIY